MSETFTPNLILSKFDQGDNPPILTAAKMNANWDKIDLEIFNRIRKDGTVPFTGPQSMGGFRLRNNADPLLPTDLVTLAYFDAKDRFAATRIVDPSGAGTHTTIAAALASLPAAGGTIFLKGVTYNLSAGLVIPANVRIIGAGRNSTILNMTGAFTLFTTSGGYFCLSEVTVQGDDASAQIVLNTDHNVDIACSDFKNIYGMFDAVSSAADISQSDCFILLAASAGTGIFLWKGATGGTLKWTYVWMSIPITSATLVEGPTGGSPGCDWKVVQSYTGGPPPPVSNFYYLQTITWVNFDIDFSKITVSGDGSIAVGCGFDSCWLRMLGFKNKITGCTFTLGGNDAGVWIAQLILAAVGGNSETVVSGCSFRGNGVSFRAIAVENCYSNVITGCLFGSHTAQAIYMESGTSPAFSGAVVTGCKFEESQSVYENGVDVVGSYNFNVGFNDNVGPVIVGPLSMVDDGNVRSTSVNITLDATRRTVPVDASGAPRTITVPLAAEFPYQIFTVLKTDSSGNSVTLARSGANLIGGATTKVLAAQYDKYRIQSDGVSNWWII